MLILWIVITVLAGYLLGGINGAIIISRLLAHEDVRKKGSGNAGLTNFQRNYGNKGSVLVILVDVAKTVAACLLGGALLGQFGMADTGRMLGGAACMVGHMFPLLFGFHGGKGVLCGAALAACMDWRAFCIVFGVFLIAVLLTRYISLGSLLAAVAYPFAFAWCFWGNWAVLAIALAVAVLAIWMHRGNIGRLVHGNERKFHLKKGKDGEA